MSNITRTEPYTALASIYQKAGFSAYSLQLAPHLLAQAFEMEWTGRVGLDLACGTGDLDCWLGENGLRMIGVDVSAPMLRIGQEQARRQSVDVQFAVGDMRTYKPDVAVDMVFCVGGSLNYIPTLRDLEAVFRQAQAALIPGKLFYFDLRTIRGLADAANAPQIVFDNGDDSLILARNTFSFETLLLNTQYTVFRYEGGWQRAEETHLLRGYPVQAVTSLLTKTGFRLLRTLTSELEPAEQHRDAPLLLFAAIRED